MANICSVSVRVTSNGKEDLDKFLDSLTDEVFDEDYLDRQSDTLVYLGANTNWEAPTDYIRGLSKQFPTLLFNLSAHEPGMGVNQRAVFQNGVMIDMTHEYYELLLQYCLDRIRWEIDKEEQDHYNQQLFTYLDDGVYDIIDDYQDNWNRFLTYVDDPNQV